jgi:hypothetical protein
MVIIFWARCPISFEHVSFWYPFLEPLQTTYHSNTCAQIIKIRNWVRHVHLTPIETPRVTSALLVLWMNNTCTRELGNELKSKTSVGVIPKLSWMDERLMVDFSTSLLLTLTINTFACKIVRKHMKIPLLAIFWSLPKFSPTFIQFQSHIFLTHFCFSPNFISILWRRA